MGKEMLKHQLNEFHYPPEVLAPEGKPIAPKTADDINDMFRELDSEPEVKEPKIKEDKSDKEDKEPAELDDDLELKDPDEDLEKLDLSEKPDDDLNIDAPPRKKEILKKYPEVFKDFPFLEKMMYRDKQYTELFGSFDDAKEISERSESFNNFENQLLSGNTLEILKEVKSADENAFNQIVDEYLPTLAKVDKEAYLHVTGNLNRRLIMEMVQEANDLEKNDPDKSDLLKQAALIVNQFIFGNSKFTAPTRLTANKVDDVEHNKVEQEKLDFVRERFETSRDDLQSRVDNTLRATITDYIDPKGNMSAYVKKNAVADAMKILTSSIASDEAFVKNMDKLWRVSFENKFSKDSLNKIQSYYLSKAKSGLKNAILKARAEALKDSPPRSREKDEEIEEETPRRQVTRTIAPGRPSQSKGKNSMQKGESVYDFFGRD